MSVGQQRGVGRDERAAATSAAWAWRGLVAVALVALGAGCGGSGTTVREGTGQGAVDHTPPPRSSSAVDDFQQAATLWQQPADTRDLSRIEDLLESAVDKDETFAQAWFNLGVVRQQMGDESGAETAYRQSNAVDSHFVDGLGNIAAMELEHGQTEQAQQLLEQVVATDQFNPGANLNLARIYRLRAKQGGAEDRDMADQAINRIRLSLAGNAMNVDAYETLAAVYYDLERYRLAHLVCLNAIALGLQSAALYNRLGLILLAEDDVTGAYAQFRQAVSMDPGFVEASMNLGAVALNYRDYAGAREAFERVLSVQPDNVSAMISRAVALRGLDDLNGAEQGYQAVLDIDPNNLSALYDMGVLYQEYQQDYATALQWFQRYQRADRGGSSELASDVQTRIGLLQQLIQELGSTGGAAAPVDENASPGASQGAPAEEGTGEPAPVQ